MKAMKIVTVPDKAAFQTEAASKYLGISKNTLRKRADRGLIRCKRDVNGHRVFLVEDLDAYLLGLPDYNPDDNPNVHESARTGRKKGGSI
jgi:hypothetical protein